MKKPLIKKALSCVLVGSTLSTVLITGQPVQAALGYWPEPLPISNEYYLHNETLQPYGAAFQIDELKNWTPDNDPDARYNRSAVPLAKRWMGPSVNPNASRDARIIPLSGTSARASQSPSQGGDGAYTYAMTNFQYVDINNYWGGSSAEGPIAIPTPEHIDSAHRNGVKATGTIFIPWGDSAYGGKFIDQLVEQDAKGNFVAADKLVEIAQYYGFDGFTINQESSSSPESMAKLKEMLAYIQEKKPDNFTMAWYNGKGQLGESDVKNWMQDGDTRLNNDWWLDMSWRNINASIKSVVDAGRSPFDIHATWENFPYTDKGADVTNLIGPDGKLKTSLGILGPNATLISSKSIDDFMNHEDLRLWTGPAFDPRDKTRTLGVFPGFSNLVADQTPIIGNEFATNFTVGNGKKFYEDGIVTGKEKGWYNRSLTDITPTWRWIVDSKGSKLAPNFDYEDAWWGGSSLKLSGNLDANQANHIKLYSSQLEITDNSKISITYKTPASDVDVYVGLCFGDTYDDSNFEFYPVPAGTEKNGWTTSTIDLSKHDKKAIAISLKINANEDVKDYSINIGRLAFTTNEAAPAATSAITLDDSIYVNDTTAEARIYWDKSANASLYTIHRVYADGTKEFIGATPSDAFYLGRFVRDNEEAQTTFEITSYSANGTVGGVKTFNFNWPAVTGGFEVAQVEGTNIALNVPVVDDGSFDPGGKVDKINDGVIPNSKWASGKTIASAYFDLGKDMDISRWVVKHANVAGAGEGVDFNTDTFDLQYAKDDRQPILDPNDPTSKQRVIKLNYTKVDEVIGNRQDVTDRVLDTPITARYIRLHVTKSDNCPWHAIRIYEFELYENPYVPHSTALLDRNVTVKNNVGATDSVVLDNVAMPIGSGGTVADDTGIVKIYDSLKSDQPIAEVKATQPNNKYKQLNRGVASFENLTLIPEGGRLYYTTNVNGVVSLRSSIEYAPEVGTEIKLPTSIKLEHSLMGNQTRSKYGVFTLEGLDVGTSMKIYETADSQSPILHSQQVEEGQDFIRQARVPLSKDGGTLYYELKQYGKPNSGRLEYTYDPTNELYVDQASLKDLVNRYSNLHEANYVPATWGPFSIALNAIKAALSTAVTASDAEGYRAALEESALALRSIGNIQRLKEVCNEYEKTYTEDQYTADSFKLFSDVLEKTKGIISGVESSTIAVTKTELEKLRFDLDNVVSRLVEGGDHVVDSVTITPNDVDGKIGTTLTFKAKVAGNAGDTVIWDVYGNSSQYTTISDGVLRVAADEEIGGVLTVKATSTFDTTKSGIAQVLVVNELLPKVISVTIPDQVDFVEAGKIQQFTANVAVKNDASTSVTWAVYGAENVDTKIFNGLLMVNENETADQLTIRATSEVDSTKFADKTIRVVKDTDEPYTITVGVMTNGSVTSDLSTAKPSQTVKLTVTPDAGYQLKTGSLKVNGNVILEDTFTMPAEDVIITAEFEKIPGIELVSIQAPTAITGLPNGTLKTIADLKLPATVVLVTNNGKMNAVVAWDVNSADYDPSVKTEQTFTVNGEVILPSDLVNTNSISLKVSIGVTVLKKQVVSPPVVQPPSGGGEVTTKPVPVYETTVSQGKVTTVTSVKTTDENGIAVTTVPGKLIDDAITTAVSKAADQGVNTEVAIKLDVDAPSNAKAVKVTLSNESLMKFTSNTAVTLTISTPIGTMTFGRNAISSISDQATGTVTITATKMEPSTLDADYQHKVGDRPVVNFDITSGDKTISEFSGNITVTIPYALKSDEKPIAVVAYHINTAGQLNVVKNGVYDVTTQTLTFSVPHFSQYAVGYNNIEFTDVAANAWYNDAVSYLAARDITNGLGNGNFGPETKVSRAQSLVMIMKAFGINPDQNSENNFGDAGNTYYTGYLAAAKRLGITDGAGNNMFAPEKEVTRQEMFVLTYNTLKSINALPTGTTPNELKNFKDSDTVSAYATAAMTYFVNNGVISGLNGNLLPVDKATRAEFAQTLYNIMTK
ncbi:MULTISPECIES: endo-beta-N-acetylglucosaminidase [Paenibacillus]|uniref:Mannosyl-glycoprotein endo-beta-N-acetylglucosaminidase n=1 Tax=Paenibacillus odorifer TaxID=189426 RepID=A0ABX3HWC5_9BACL|nr:S-layer homology domain-containing protein [Paenibacillus odorifer]OMD54682.1 hypothetical protein BSK51_06355 [Paenibacillus odorifer]